MTGSRLAAGIDLPLTAHQHPLQTPVLSAFLGSAVQISWYPASNSDILNARDENYVLLIFTSRRVRPVELFPCVGRVAAGSYVAPEGDFFALREVRFIRTGGPVKGEAGV